MQYDNKQNPSIISNNPDGVIFFKEIKIKDNFELADQFYNIHIYSNYTIIALISLHILAVIAHKLLFKDNLLKRML